MLGALPLAFTLLRFDSDHQCRGRASSFALPVAEAVSVSPREAYRQTRHCRVGIPKFMERFCKGRGLRIISPFGFCLAVFHLVVCEVPPAASCEDSSCRRYHQMLSCVRVRQVWPGASSSPFSVLRDALAVPTQASCLSLGCVRVTQPLLQGRGEEGTALSHYPWGQ